MQHKIFVGIQLPETIKKRLSKALEKWQDLPVKWIPADNFHVTLLFLGYVNYEDVISVCDSIREIAEDSQSFDLLLQNITLAPDEKDPRMFWLRGEESEEMRELVEKLEQVLKKTDVEKKSFRPHVTLGRIRHEKWEALLEKPVVDQKFSVSVPASSVEIFESTMVNGKSKFIVLESCPLN
jgi:2'-5' RNA ligase